MHVSSFISNSYNVLITKKKNFPTQALMLSSVTVEVTILPATAEIPPYLVGVNVNPW